MPRIADLRPVPQPRLPPAAASGIIAARMKQALPTDAPSLIASALAAMKRALGYAFLFAFAVNLLSMLMPIYSLQVFDRVFATRSADTLIALTAVVLVGYLFYGAFYAIRAGIIARIVEWLERTVAPKLLRVSIIFAAESGQAQAGQHQRDLMTLKNYISTAAPTLMDVPWSLLFLLVIYMINPLLGFIAALSILMLITAALINEYATRKALMRAGERSVEAISAADSLGRSGEAIQAMGMAGNVIARWQEDTARGLTLQDTAQQRSAIITGCTRALRMIMQVAITCAGAYLALRGEITSGGIVATSMLTARALSPFEGTIQMWKNFVSARDAYRRLHLLVSTVGVGLPETTLPTPRGMLTAENLYITISGTPILRGISLQLQPGESLGIIGPSAAGKSTLAKAMVGIYQPVHGVVRLDGADLYHWPREDAGPHIGYLPQHVELFHGTIKQNIARMEKNASDEAVIEAAQKAGVHQMILQLPKGYDTIYHPGNVVLSPGQRQRIGLARALYGKPRVIVLDEPNSNMDGDGERALMVSLQFMKEAGMTTIIVAHRPSVLATVDKVLMLRGGIVEILGERDEVLSRFTTGGARRLQDAGGQS